MFQVSLICFVLAATAAFVPIPASAQLATADARSSRQQPIGQSTADRAEQTAKRFGAGLQAGVGLDPELVDVGAHITLGPVFKPEVTFRPGVEIGLGELTTLFAINLDVLYLLNGSVGDRSWSPYVGIGPSFGLSHRGFSTDDADNVTITSPGTSTSERGRFDFGDTDFNSGMNFIAGVRKRNGLFLEMKATAWGVSNIRLLAGFNF
jgi:hypothetical protein